MLVMSPMLHFITENVCFFVAEGVDVFEPNWVLVSTWLNVAPDAMCRSHSILTMLGFVYSDGLSLGVDDGFCVEVAKRSRVRV